MNCFRCGLEVEQGAVFCSHCGAPLTMAEPSQAAAPPQEAAAPQQSAPPKKKRTGLIIGLIAGGVALVGVLIAAYFLFFGPGIEGLWVCEDRGWALRIEDSVLTEYSPAGTGETSYTYQDGQGTAMLSSGEVSFTVSGGEMTLVDEETGEKYLFVRQGDDADVEDVIAAGIRGLWSNEELGHVAELGRKDSFKLHSVSGELEGDYSFDLKNGRGTITLDGKEYRFKAGWDLLSIEELGDFHRADNGLDVAAFVHQHGLGRLIATWYDTAGKDGSITFKADGTFFVEVYGLTLTGTYTFDTATGAGVLTLDDDANNPRDFTLLDGTLTLENAENTFTYTQEYVEQPGAEDYYTAIAGVWEGAGTVVVLVFKEGGTMIYYVGGISMHGTYTFDPLSNTGTLWEGEPNGEGLDFVVLASRGLLIVNGKFYERQGMEEPADVHGIWFCEDGTSGTLYFDGEGNVIAEKYSLPVLGTYTFDESTGTGKMTLDYGGITSESNLYLRDGKLYKDSGSPYTKAYVEQATEP